MTTRHIQIQIATVAARFSPFFGLWGERVISTVSATGGTVARLDRVSYGRSGGKAILFRDAWGVYRAPCIETQWSEAEDVTTSSLARAPQVRIALRSLG